MSEIAGTTIARRPALAHAPLGSPSSDLRLSAMPEGHILQALAAPGAGDIAQRLESIGDGTRFAVRPVSPGQWFVVGDGELSQEEWRDTSAAIADVAALCDQSGGRVRIALSGPAAETVLSRGTAVDVFRAAFPIGRSAPTLFGHIGIHLTRIGDADFELIVLRSFAQSLWEELEGLGRAYFGAA